ncbi:glutathione-regulated potassium-efflux system protein KefC [Comamonas sediminis]|jgi:glutathione-regulated potassium-efflux system ancillary protein KefC|uniref:Glutathione-regulated potassium-efflux system protein KefC n=3 Tax=Comamonas TaxID=283 RepID=A0ABV4B7U4_9BURK|nr:MULTISPECIES: glutathione-regulated potassium-efflux system protein KefC [unclassified Comamonas]ULR87847.1 glutathione-regulated potassium-efflux system protein KefC [Comamonas sp. B21-038]
MEHAPAWLTYTFLYLAAAVIAVPISRALGLGTIIGYLVAGMIIGPSGLQLVSNVQDILHFSEFGVVLMLFLIGLELQPSRLWSMRRPIFGVGTAQVLLCTAGLFAAGLVFGYDWHLALIAALGLALSSTAIALQSIAERNLMSTTSGKTSFAILLFQDVAAIPILALIPLLAVGHQAAQNDGNVLMEIGKTLAIIVAVILVGRYLLRPVLRWIAQSESREISTATALLLVVGIAFLMLQIGLSMALGAFLAGVLLADSEFRAELEADIEPFKGLLLGLFFIAVGMSIDFSVILQAPLTMLVLVLLFLLIKSVVIYGLAKLLRMPVQERPLFTLLLAQGGEFAFVVFSAAQAQRILTPQQSSLLIGSVAISMVATPLIVAAMDRWLMPRFANLTKGDDVPPELSEQQEATVLIAGFGRYGQIVTRVLLSQGIKAVILDHSVEMLEVAQNFGYRVFYGDATRQDLLRIAGAEKAEVMVIAVDDELQTNQIVRLVQQHFPHLKIVARAKDVAHWYALRDMGVHHVDREVFDSSLQTAEKALELMGYSEEDAQYVVTVFRAHNIELSDKMYEHHHDRETMLAVAKQGREQLVEQMARERQERQEQVQEAKDAPSSPYPPPPEDPHSQI